MTALAIPQGRGTPRLFGYGAPVGPVTLAEWQAELDRVVPPAPKRNRLLLRWEPGEPWQPIGRWMIWLCLDPQHVEIEPWIRWPLNGPNPRSTGHYCGDGFCLCDMKRNRWVGGATKMIDAATWRLFRETGLYGVRWWTIQGNKGGHRFQWSKDEAACLLSQMRGGPGQTPAPGDLPYAPFDARVLRGIERERKIKSLYDKARSFRGRKDALALEERDEQEVIAKALWDWTGEQAESLWSEGGDAIPHVLEMQYGRAPVGHKLSTDYEAVERAALERPVI
jgi:hypothetical protein